MTVRLDPPADGPANMASDLELGRANGWAARVYTWDGPWVTLGRFQDPSRDLMPGAPVPWVRRPTGGGGVLHGHDVTVGVAMPLPDGRARKLRDVYRALVRPLAEALTEAGVPAVLAEDVGGAGSLPAADCFAGVSRNDVVDPSRGVKVCGCALRVFPGWALVQASVPAGPPLVAPAEVFPAAAPARWSRLDAPTLANALDRAIRHGMETNSARSL